MVTYELESREGDVLIFRYWPEDDRQSKPGQFVVDLASETANLVEPAEGGFKCRTTGAEMNSMRDAINDMRAERGEPPLTEKEPAIARFAIRTSLYATMAILEMVSQSFG